MELRPYQEDAVNKAFAAAEEWYASDKPRGGVYMEMATGTGKTVVFQTLARRLSKKYKKPVFILTHALTLLRQGITDPDGEPNGFGSLHSDYGADCTFEGESVYYITPQTLSRGSKQAKSALLLAEEVKGCFLLQDECHYGKGKASRMYNKIYGAIEDCGARCFTIGASATPYLKFSPDASERVAMEDEIARDPDGELAEEYEAVLARMEPLALHIHPDTAPIFSKCVFDYGVEKGTAGGFLSGLEYHNEAIEGLAALSSLQGRKDIGTDGEVKTSVQDDVVARNMSAIIDKVLRTTPEGKQAIIFLPSRKTASILSDYIAQRGVTADYVAADGGLCGKGAEENAAVIARFKAGKFSFLCNTAMLTTGFDMPSLEYLFLARNVRSQALFTQICGRVSRTYPGKEFGHIYDLANSLSSVTQTNTTPEKPEWGKQGKKSDTALVVDFKGVLEMPPQPKQWPLIPEGKNVWECTGITPKGEPCSGQVTRKQFKQFGHGPQNSFYCRKCRGTQRLVGVSSSGLYPYKFWPEAINSLEIPATDEGLQRYLQVGWDWGVDLDNGELVRKPPKYYEEAEGEWLRPLALVHLWNILTKARAMEDAAREWKLDKEGIQKLGDDIITILKPAAKEALNTFEIACSLRFLRLSSGENAGDALISFWNKRQSNEPDADKSKRSESFLLTAAAVPAILFPVDRKPDALWCSTSESEDIRGCPVCGEDTYAGTQTCIHCKFELTPYMALADKDFTIGVAPDIVLRGIIEVEKSAEAQMLRLKEAALEKSRLEAAQQHAKSVAGCQRGATIRQYCLRGVEKYTSRNGDRMIKCIFPEFTMGKKVLYFPLEGKGARFWKFNLRHLGLLKGEKGAMLDRVLTAAPVEERQEILYRFLNNIKDMYPPEKVLHESKNSPVANVLEVKPVNTYVEV